jgi:hypothetical protein
MYIFVFKRSIKLHVYCPLRFIQVCNETYNWQIECAAKSIMRSNVVALVIKRTQNQLQCNVCVELLETLISPFGLMTVHGTCE